MLTYKLTSVFTRMISADKLGDILVYGLRETMKLKDRNATGKTSMSIYRVFYPNTMVLEIFGASHMQYVDRGRKAGKFPPLDRIIEWCVARSIPKEAAYPIARKIANHGSPTMKDSTAIDQSKLGVVEDTLTRIRPQLIEELDRQVKAAFFGSVNPSWTKRVK